MDLSGPAFGGDAQGLSALRTRSRRQASQTGLGKWSTCHCTVGAVHSNLVRPRGVRTQSRQALATRTWTAGAECFRVPATERGRHGNGDNRAGTATAGTADTEDRPSHRVLGRNARSVCPLWADGTAVRSPVNLPFFGQTVVISDPILVKDIFSTSDDLIERPTRAVLGPVFGPGSTFSLTGEEHLAAPQIGAPAVSREAGEKLRAHHRRRGDARNRELAGGPRVRNASADEPPDPQRRSCVPCSAPRDPRLTSFAACCRPWSHCSPLRRAAAANAA